MAIINTDKLSLTLGKKQVLNDISLTVEQGRITTLIGKSGAGKTSLLRCLAHLTTDYTGTVAYHDKPMASLSPKERIKAVGFVFQQFNLFPHLSVLENCIQPQMVVLERTHTQAQEVALETLRSLGLEDLASRRPDGLSGGQQQRVAIARALCLHPEVLLFDEPTSALDPDSSRSLRDLLFALRDKGVTMVISSHDMSFIRGMLDKVYFVDQGRLQEVFDQKTDILSDKTQIAHFLSH